MGIILLILLCLASPASSRELKLAAWNLSWLTLRPAGDPALPPDVEPKRLEDIDLLRSYALRLDADVIAFSEVDGLELAARVFPPDRYTIHITADGVVQRAGFAIRHGLAFRANPDLVALDVHPKARFHLRSAADITLDLPQGALRLLAVHLKSGCSHDPLAASRNPACATLAEQLPPLQDWIETRRREGVAFALIGDFNRWMEGRDPFFQGLAQSGPLLRVTAGLYTPCWGGGGFLDHIIVGNAALNWIRPETVRVLTYRETGPAWKQRLSDHCPISARMALPD